MEKSNIGVKEEKKMKEVLRKERDIIRQVLLPGEYFQETAN
jgi:hypothetical protein